MTIIEQLKALEAKATPGPWMDWPDKSTVTGGDLGGIGQDGKGYPNVCTFGTCGRGWDGDTKGEPFSEDDKRLVIFVRNNALALIAIGEAAEAWSEAESRYIATSREHSKWCEGPTDKADQAATEYSRSATLRGITQEDLRTVLSTLSKGPQ